MAESFREAVSSTGLDHLHRQSKRFSDSTQWPPGVGRVCNARKICFGFALMTVSVVLAVESICTLISSGHELGSLYVAATLHSIFTPHCLVILYGSRY